METINIAVSQTVDGKFNLVITKTRELEDATQKRDNVIKIGIELTEVKELINAL